MNNTTSGTETVENVDTPETTETETETEAVETEDVETPDGDDSVDGGEENVELMTIEELLGLKEEEEEGITEDEITTEDMPMEDVETLFMERM